MKYIHFRTVDGQHDWQFPITEEFATTDFVVLVNGWHEQGGVMNRALNLFVPWHRLDYIELRDESNKGFTDFRRRMGSVG